jgi:hypothetical protein
MVRFTVISLNELRPPQQDADRTNTGGFPGNLSSSELVRTVRAPHFGARAP